MKQNNKFYRVGDVVISVVKVTDEFIIFKFTGKENGFETAIKIAKEKALQLYHAINDAKHISPSMRMMVIDKIHAKHREYTKLNDEPEFTYKFYESKNADISVISKGGHCIISISADRDYRSFSFRTYDFEETFFRMAEEVKRQYIKHRMDNWN